MNIVNLPIEHLKLAGWSANVMEAEDQARLKASLARYGLVQNSVVRPDGAGAYEVLGGNQRLKEMRDAGIRTVPCVIVDLGDADARLLAQALNHIHGEDDLGLKAEVIRTVLRELPEAEVLTLLPESSESLASLTDLGQTDLADHLLSWQAAQATKLRHMTIQLTEHQADVVERAMDLASERVNEDSSNPNKRGNALYSLCSDYLQKVDDDA